MSVMLRQRQYHALLGAMVVLAYVSGEWGRVHVWLGYGVTLLILVRLIWAMTGVRQLGLSRFYPVFSGLRLGTALTHPAISRTLLLGIATTVIGTTTTGMMMDRGRAIGLADATIGAPAYADDSRQRAGGRERRGNGILDDIHEALSNLLVLFVTCHVAYVLLFKFSLARFMRFVETPRQDEQGTISNPG